MTVYLRTKYKFVAHTVCITMKWAVKIQNWACENSNLDFLQRKPQSCPLQPSNEQIFVRTFTFYFTVVCCFYIEYGNCLLSGRKLKEAKAITQMELSNTTQM